MNKEGDDINRIPKWLNKYYIAHRGFFDDKRPENSMGAFKAAINNNFAIELDVQIMKDNTLIVFHDSNLKRMTGRDIELHNSSYNEIKEIKLLNTNEGIPTLGDVLSLVNGQIPLMIELKNETRNTKLEKLSYNLLKSYKGDFIIQSFNPISIKWFKNNAKEVIRGQLSCRYKNSDLSIIKKIILRNMLLNIITKPDFVIYDINDLDSFVIKYLKFIKKYIYGYTAKSIEEYNDALSKGVLSCFEGFDPLKKY